MTTIFSWTAGAHFTTTFYRGPRSFPGNVTISPAQMRIVATGISAQNFVDIGGLLREPVIVSVGDKSFKAGFGSSIGVETFSGDLVKVTVGEEPGPTAQVLNIESLVNEVQVGEPFNVRALVKNTTNQAVSFKVGFSLGPSSAPGHPPEPVWYDVGYIADNLGEYVPITLDPGQQKYAIRMMNAPDDTTVTGLWVTVRDQDLTVLDEMKGTGVFTITKEVTPVQFGIWQSLVDAVTAIGQAVGVVNNIVLDNIFQLIHGRQPTEADVIGFTSAAATIWPAFNVFAKAVYGTDLQTGQPATFTDVTAEELAWAIFDIAITGVGIAALGKIGKTALAGRAGTASAQLGYIEPGITTAVGSAMSNPLWAKLMAKATFGNVIKVLGLAMGVSILSTWFASDNVETMVNMDMNEILDAVTFGGMPYETARAEMDKLKTFLDAAIAWVNTNSAVNPILWVFGEIFTAGAALAENSWQLKSDLLDALAPTLVTKLVVNTVPSGATVTVEGFIQGTSPFVTDTIMSGTYNIIVELDNYETQERIVNVPPNRTTTEDFFMKSVLPAEQFGSIGVTSNPDKATVFINDVQNPFPTNTVIQDLLPDIYVVKLTKQGFQEISEVVTVTTGDQVQLNFTLTPITGPPTPEEPVVPIEVILKELSSIEVITIPDKADIYLDGLLYPWKSNTVIQNLTPGTFLVEVRKTGFDTQAQTISVGPGDRGSAQFNFSETPEPPPPPPPPAKMGKLVIDTDPSDVDIFRAAILMGNSGPSGHFEIDLSPAVYDLKLKKAGYFDKNRTVLIFEEQSTTLSAVLSKIPVTEKVWRVDVSAKDVEGNPLSAKIIVNNTSTGKWTPDFILLDPGDYVFRIEKFGFVPAEVPVHLEVIL